MTQLVLFCANTFYAHCTEGEKTDRKCCQEIIFDYLLSSTKRLQRSTSEGNRKPWGLMFCPAIGKNL